MIKKFAYIGVGAILVMTLSSCGSNKDVKEYGENIENSESIVTDNFMENMDNNSEEYLNSYNDDLLKEEVDNNLNIYDNLEDEDIEQDKTITENSFQNDLVNEAIVGKEYAISGGYLTYIESDNEMIITGCYGEYTTDSDKGRIPYANNVIVIPNKIDGKYVREVKGDSFSKSNIENVIVLDSDVKIEKGTFLNANIFLVYNFEGDSLEDVANDRIIVKNLTTSDTVGKYGFIDKNGQVVIPCVYEYVMNFSEELACVKQNGMYGYINKSGLLEIPFDYVYANSFFEGVAIVSTDGGELKILYKNHDEISLGMKYVPIATTRFKNGFAIVTNPATGKNGLINKKGEEVAPCIYDKIEISDDIKAKKDGEYIILNVEKAEVDNI